MPPDNHKRRITVLETIVATNNENVMKGIAELKGFLVRSADQRVEMLQTLTTVANQQAAFTKYQEGCDADRAKLGKRVGTVEGFQRSQKRYIIASGIIVTFLVQGGGKIVEKIGAWFSS